MSSAKVLIIEDEEHISELVKYNLEVIGLSGNCRL